MLIAESVARAVKRADIELKVIPLYVIVSPITPREKPPGIGAPPWDPPPENIPGGWQ